MQDNETVKEIKGLVRSSLKISGLSLAQKEEFCNKAKEDFNDSYAAYLTYLLQRSEDYDKVLALVELENEIDALKKRVEKLEKVMEK